LHNVSDNIINKAWVKTRIARYDTAGSAKGEFPELTRDKGRIHGSQFG